jgi:hypothetical protein
MAKIEKHFEIKNLEVLKECTEEETFTFIVNGQKYQSPSFVAELFSPRVRALRKADRSIDSMETNIFWREGNTDEGVVGRVFSEVFSGFVGGGVGVTRENSEIVGEIGYFLGNEEVVRWSSEFEESQMESEGHREMEKEFGIAEQKARRSEDISGEADLIAEHFGEMKGTLGERGCVAVIEGVLSSGALRVETESEIADFVVCLIEKHLREGGVEEAERFSVLIGHIHSENLSVAGVERLLSLCEHDFLVVPVFECVRGRVLLGATYLGEGKEGGERRRR